MASKLTWIVAAVGVLVLAATFAEAVPAQAPTAAVATDTQRQQQLEQMQARMVTMQQQMTALQATSDPAARQKLLDAHMKTMQQQMQAMRAMGGGMMMHSMGGAAAGMHGNSGMGMGMGMGTAMQHWAAPADGDPNSPEWHDQMMQNRMDMMQMMMEHMMGQMQMQSHMGNVSK